MADEPAIIFDHISKVYHKRAGMGTLLSKIPGLRPRQSDEFWALKDVSFEAKKGECLGIIGPNGAGKSTILKILSRITSPTSGSFQVNGRLSSLIEVGAGFHPELTGRENVYLNAAILGMSKKETDAKFKDIVDFADLWDFIDVPVKRYSSGMYVRLGFAVAVHTEPDVLLVDEVLAVGDASFQRKCQQRMSDIRRTGTAIILVSHNPHIVTGLCGQVICLARGQIVAAGDPLNVVPVYEQGLSNQGLDPSVRATERELALLMHRRIARQFASGEAEFSKIEVRNARGEASDTYSWDEPVVLKATYRVRTRVVRPIFIAGCCTLSGTACCVVKSHVSNIRPDFIEGEGVLEVRFDSLPLFTGDYVLLVGIFDETQRIPLAYAREIIIHINNPATWLNEHDGIFTPQVKWQISDTARATGNTQKER